MLSENTLMLYQEDLQLKVHIVCEMATGNRSEVAQISH